MPAFYSLLSISLHQTAVGLAFLCGVKWKLGSRRWDTGNQALQLLSTSPMLPLLSCLTINIVNQCRLFSLITSSEENSFSMTLCTHSKQAVGSILNIVVFLLWFVTEFRLRYFVIRIQRLCFPTSSPLPLRWNRRRDYHQLTECLAGLNVRPKLWWIFQKSWNRGRS